MMIKLGDMVAISYGCQEDYRVLAVCMAKKDFDCIEAGREYSRWCMENEAVRVEYGEGFVNWLKDENYIEKLDCKEWCLGGVFFGHDMSLYDRLFH